MDVDLHAIVQTFLEETEEDLASMEENLVALESRPEDDELLATIFRVTHTLKGNASSLGFPAVAEFAHVLEDVLDRLRNRTLAVTSDLVSLLLRAVDALRQMVPEAAAGTEGMKPAHRGLMERLSKAGATSTAQQCGRDDDSHEEPLLVERRRSQGRRKEDHDRDRTLRVGIDKLDRMLNLTGEIAIARGRLRQALEERARGSAVEEVLEAQRELDRLCMDVQELVMRARMVSLGPLFRRYVRTVRDVAAARRKQARLVVEGEDVEVDTTVIEHIRDPLTHMIRNALDHGIELPEERLRRGKDPCGSLTLRACHEGGSIVIQVADDGAGLSRERIGARARSLGAVVEPEKLADEDLFRLVFEAGFSTAETITDLSGRGFGLDVVRRNIDALRGSVGIESAEGRGTTITLRLPLTLAIIAGFVVGVGHETYVVPLESVIECLEMPRAHSGRVGDGRVINLRGYALPCVRLRALFGLEGAPPSREHVVVVRHHGGLAGLAVDVLHGESQTVIKPLGSLLRSLPGIAGSAILGSGRVALILDVPALLKEVAGRRVRAREPHTDMASTPAHSTGPHTQEEAAPA